MSATSIKIGDERKVADSPGFGSFLLRRTLAFAQGHGPKLGWGLLSVGLFAGLWEFLWYINVADHRLLPPPHVFLGDFAGQAKNFNTAKRWEIGVDPNSGPTPFEAVLITMASSTMRILVGLAIAATASLCMGIVIRYYGLFGKLVLPTVTLLAPVSPVAWLPVAIFLFGIGNGPAIFMVFIALFFTMTLATITQIDFVNRNYINVGRTMGASKRQIYTRVILPAILPGLLVVLRLNLFGAWMVVLVAEATGVGYGLGQIISMARNTFNPGLVYFTIVIIGLLGFTFDFALRLLQGRVLFWLPKGQGGLGVADLSRSSGAAAAVSCVDVGKIWNPGSPRAHQALTGIDLEIEPGEFVVLLGPSGCGKSTLLYLIAGLEEPTSGAISAHGETVAGPAPDRSLIFQETSLFPWLNVWQNVSFGLSVRGVPAEQRKETARQVLSRVGLSDAFEKRPDELSGGMRQRVAVARALAMQPKVLLMDEPFAALDVQTRVKMQGFLLDVWDVSKASVLFVTHHIDEAIALADRVVVFTARPGRIKAIVSIKEKRPRELTSPTALALRVQLTALLQDEVDRAFAEQEVLSVAS